jgi:hypothetical protein
MRTKTPVQVRRAVGLRGPTPFLPFTTLWTMITPPMPRASGFEVSPRTLHHWVLFLQLDLNLPKLQGDEITVSRRTMHPSARKIERTRAFRDSRNRDRRIMALRETWPSLRDGSVGFAAIPRHQRSAAPTAVSTRNGASGTSSDHQLSSASFSEQASTSSSHGNRTSQKETRDDVRKAWRMLEMARSSTERKASNKPSSVINTRPPFSMGNRSTSYSPVDG